MNTERNTVTVFLLTNYWTPKGSPIPARLNAGELVALPASEAITLINDGYARPEDAPREPLDESMSWYRIVKPFAFRSKQLLTGALHRLPTWKAALMHDHVEPAPPLPAPPLSDAEKQDIEARQTQRIIQRRRAEARSWLDSTAKR